MFGPELCLYKDVKLGHLSYFISVTYQNGRQWNLNKHKFQCASHLLCPFLCSHDHDLVVIATKKCTAQFEGLFALMSLGRTFPLDGANDVLNPLLHLRVSIPDYYIY